MHETLRSSFKLQNEEAEWQRITSDSANNTFFSIYAKFQFEENSFMPKSCNVKIQNYTGSITYGISKVDSEMKYIFDKDIGDYVFLFTVKLKPLYANHEFNDVAIDFKDLSHEHYDEIIRKSKNIQNVEMPQNLSSKNLMFVNLEYENHHGNLLTADTNVNELEFIDQNYVLRDRDQLKSFSYEYFKPEQNLYDHDGPVYSDPIISTNGLKETIYYVKSKPCRDTYVRFF